MVNERLFDDIEPTAVTTISQEEQEEISRKLAEKAAQRAKNKKLKATSDKVEDTEEEEVVDSKEVKRNNLTLLTPKTEIKEIIKLSDKEKNKIKVYQDIVEDLAGNEYIVPKGVKVKYEDNEIILNLPWLIETKKGMRVNRGLLVEHLIQHLPAISVGGMFYIYKNGVYEQQDPDFAESVAKYFLTPQYASSAAMGDVGNMWKLDLRVCVNPKEINKEQHLLNFKNGVFNLNTWEFDENGHSPKRFSTIQLQAEYDETATCPTFEKFLDEAQPDKTTQLLMQEMTGYTYTSYTKSKKMLFMFFGQGDTGKSTFLNATLESIIPETGKSNVALQDLSNEYNRAEIFGKIANINGDLPSRKLDEIDFLKKASGNDAVTGRYIFQRPFTYKNTAKFIFSMNSKPNNFTGDSSDALFIRMALFTWNNKPKKKDHSLAAKLKNERNGIVQWALRGLKRLMEADFNFTESKEVNDNVEEYRIDNNPVLRFVTNYCEFDENHTVARMSLYTEFQNFMELEGLGKISQIRFNQMLLASFVNKISKANSKIDRVAIWKGIKFTGFDSI